MSHNTKVEAVPSAWKNKCTGCKCFSTSSKPLLATMPRNLVFVICFPISPEDSTNSQISHSTLTKDKGRQ